MTPYFKSRRERIFVHNKCPGGKVFDPFKSFPGVCPTGENGWR